MTDVLPYSSDDMCVEAGRLKSFNNWPFGKDAKCSASKMAEAGFFHCPTEEEKDLVQCYICFKELDGWEANDDPWEEHFSHSKICLFAKLRKPQKDLIISDIYELEAQRKINMTKRTLALKIQKFQSDCEDNNVFLLDIMKEFGKPKKKK